MFGSAASAPGERVRAWNATLLAPLLLVLFLGVLLVGRSQLAKGTNSATANGATLMVLATVLGVLSLAAAVSLDVW